MHSSVTSPFMKTFVNWQETHFTWKETPSRLSGIKIHCHISKYLCFGCECSDDEEVFGDPSLNPSKYKHYEECILITNSVTLR